MSDLDIFSATEGGGEAMSEQDFEKFKDQMKAAGAQIKAQQKSEQKQKKKEDKLYLILLKFIKDSEKRDLMLLASRLLDQNIPPAFVLSILLLGNADIQSEWNAILALPEGEKEAHDVQKIEEQDEPVIQEEITTLLKTEEHIGLQAQSRAEIDSWVKYMHEQALTNPQKLIDTAVDEDGNLKLMVLQLATFVLRDFLETQNAANEYENLSDFITVVLDKIIEDAKNSLRSKRLADPEKGEGDVKFF